MVGKNEEFFFENFKRKTKKIQRVGSSWTNTDQDAQ